MGGGALRPKNPQNYQKRNCTKIDNTSGTGNPKNVEKYLEDRFPYTVEDTESESDIQDNSLLYTIHQKYQNTFLKIRIFEHFKIQKNNIVTEKMFFLRISIIFCMREAVTISDGSRILPCPRGLKNDLKKRFTFGNFVYFIYFVYFEPYRASLIYIYIYIYTRTRVGVVVSWCRVV